MSLYARLAVLAAVLLALAAGAWKCYHAGASSVRAEWTAEKLETERLARLREQTLTRKNEEVANAYQLEKKRRAAADLLAADRLRDLTAALASADAAASGGTDADPRNAIIRECTGALVALDSHASKLAGQVGALQDYTKRVCMSP